MSNRRRPGIGDKTPVPDDGYPSARDLPTFLEFDEKLRAMKALAALMPSLRSEVRNLEGSLREITDSVDGFYRVLAGRDWVYHDQLNIAAMRAPIEANNAEDLESLLVALYSDPDQLSRLLNQLRFQPNMPERMPLVELAREDHLAGRYYSVTLTLLAVMDGFVNEIEKARRGLSSRDAVDIKPWNSVVGHHGGLKAAHRSFTKTFKATSTEEIFTLHRNGIVHGTLTEFNNVVVAAKAWNRLLAVNDWARSLTEASKPPAPPPPSIRQSMHQVAATAKRMKRLDNWLPRTVDRETDNGNALALEPVAIAAKTLFESWMSGNYGKLGALLREAPKKNQQAKFAGEVRRRFGTVTLDAFEVEKIEMLSSSAAVVTATLTIAGASFRNETRWLREDEARHSVPEFEDGGEWRSVHYYPDEYGTSTL